MVACRLSDQWLKSHVSCWKSSTHSVREHLALQPVCQYVSKRRVAWSVGKCERTAGSQRGDIIARRVLSIGEVTHARPRISAKVAEDWTLLCTANFQALVTVHTCLCMRLHTNSLQFPKPWWFVCLPACLFTPAVIFLLSAVCTKWTTNHTKAKGWQRLSRMAKRLHNQILSVLCTHLCTHKLGCRWKEAQHVHTPYSHCLFSAYSNTLWACADRRCTRRCTCTHSPGTPPLQFSWQAGPSLPWGGEMERRRKRSVDPVMCVLFTPQLPVLSLSVFIFLFPQFQAANSAVCQLSSQPCEIAHKRWFPLYPFYSPQGTQTVVPCTWQSPAKSRSQTVHLFFYE